MARVDATFIPHAMAETGPGEAGTTLLLAEPEVKTKRPSMFKVVLLNDDYTPMDFVVYLLQEVFRRNHEEAVTIMLAVHTQGAGVCGVYTRDVAETKAEQAVAIARSNEYPLQCTLEKA